MGNQATVSARYKEKKARQEAEGAVAWKEYLLQQRSISDRMARQRAERLERERSRLQ